MPGCVRRVTQKYLMDGADGVGEPPELPDCTTPEVFVDTTFAHQPESAAHFGFDATAGVVHDWMYESLAKEYVLDETNQEFMRKSNPWALRGIVEKLHEAADRGLWEEPDPEVVAAMQQVYLELEGDLEDR